MVSGLTCDSGAGQAISKGLQLKTCTKADLESVKKPSLMMNTICGRSCKAVKLQPEDKVLPNDKAGQEQLVDTLFTYMQLRTCTKSALAVLPAIVAAVHEATRRVGTVVWDNNTAENVLDRMSSDVDTHERWVMAMLRKIAQHTCNDSAMAVKILVAETMRTAMLITPMTYLEASKNDKGMDFRQQQLANTIGIDRQTIQTLAEMAMVKLGKAMEETSSCSTARKLLFDQLKNHNITLDRPMNLNKGPVSVVPNQEALACEGMMMMQDGSSLDEAKSMELARLINSGHLQDLSYVDDVIAMSNMNGTVKVRCIQTNGTVKYRYVRRKAGSRGSRTHWQDVMPRKRPELPDIVVRQYVEKCIKEYEDQIGRESTGTTDAEFAAAVHESITGIEASNTATSFTPDVTAACDTAVASVCNAPECQAKAQARIRLQYRIRGERFLHMQQDITKANSREATMEKGGAYYLTNAERAVWDTASRYILKKAEFRAWGKAKHGQVATSSCAATVAVNEELAGFMRRAASIRTIAGIDSSSSDDDTTDEDMPELVPITDEFNPTPRHTRSCTPSQVIVTQEQGSSIPDEKMDGKMLATDHDLNTPRVCVVMAIAKPEVKEGTKGGVNDPNRWSPMSQPSCSPITSPTPSLTIALPSTTQGLSPNDKNRMSPINYDPDVIMMPSSLMNLPQQQQNRPTDIVRRSHRIANRNSTPYPKRSRPSQSITRNVRQKTLTRDNQAFIRVADAILTDPEGEMRIRVKFPAVVRGGKVEVKDEWLLVHNTTLWMEVVNLVRHYLPFQQYKVAVNQHRPVRLSESVGKYQLYKDDCIHIMQKHRGGSDSEDVDEVLDAVEPIFEQDWYEENEGAFLPPQSEVENEDVTELQATNTEGVISEEVKVEELDEDGRSSSGSELSDGEAFMRQIEVRGDDGDEREEAGPSRTQPEQEGDAVLLSQLKLMGIVNEDGSSNEDFLQFVEARNQDRQGDGSSSERSRGITPNYMSAKQVWGEGERVQMTAPRQAIENTTLYQSIAAGVDIIANRLANPTTTISPEIPSHGPGTAQPVFGPTHEPRPQQNDNDTGENRQSMFSQIGESRGNENMDTAAQSHHVETGYDTSDQEHVQNTMSSRLLRNQSVRQQVDTRIRRRRQSDIEYNDIHRHRNTTSPTTPARTDQSVNKGGLRGGQSQQAYSHGKVAEPSFHDIQHYQQPPRPPPTSEVTSKLRASIKLPTFSGRAEDWKQWARSLLRYLAVNELDSVIEEGYLISQQFSYNDNKFVYYAIDQSICDSTKALSLFRTAPQNDGHTAYMALYNGFTFTGTASAPILMHKLTSIRLRSGEMLSAFILRLGELFEDLESLPGNTAFQYNDTQKIHYLLSSIRHERDLQPAYHAIQMASTRGEITYEEACEDLRVRCEAIRADEALTGHTRKSFISTEPKRLNDRAVSFVPTTRRPGGRQGRVDNHSRATNHRTKPDFRNKGGSTEAYSLCLADGCHTKDRLPFCRLHFAEMICGRVTTRKLRDGLGEATYNRDTNRAVFPSTVPEERQRPQKRQ